MDSPYKLKTEQSTPASEDLTKKMMAEIPAIESKVLEIAKKSTDAPVYPTYASTSDISNQETSSSNPEEKPITTPNVVEVTSSTPPQSPPMNSDARSSGEPRREMTGAPDTGIKYDILFEKIAYKCQKLIISISIHVTWIYVLQ